MEGIGIDGFFSQKVRDLPMSMDSRIGTA